jgi:hypothetical protein
MMRYVFTCNILIESLKHLTFKKAKKSIDDDKVEIVEPPTKKGCTGKERVVNDEVCLYL